MSIDGAAWKQTYKLIRSFLSNTLLSFKLIHIYSETWALLAHAQWALQLKVPHLSAASFHFSKLISQRGGEKERRQGRGRVKTWHAVWAPFPYLCPGDQTLQMLSGALSHSHERQGIKKYELTFREGGNWKIRSWTAFSAPNLASPWLYDQPQDCASPGFSKVPCYQEEHNSSIAGALVEVTHLPTTLQRCKTRFYQLQ